MFFDEIVINKIMKHKNEYGHLTIHNKSTYANSSAGAWVETNSEETRKLIALLSYQGLVPVTGFKEYWSTKSLYHGLWTRDIMSRNRYSALMFMKHAVGLTNNDKNEEGSWFNCDHQVKIHGYSSTLLEYSN